MAVIFRCNTTTSRSPCKYLRLLLAALPIDSPILSPCVSILPETFGEGIVVDFQLSNLQVEQHALTFRTPQHTHLLKREKTMKKKHTTISAQMLRVDLIFIFQAKTMSELSKDDIESVLKCRYALNTPPPPLLRFLRKPFRRQTSKNPRAVHSPRPVDKRRLTFSF